MLTDMSQWNYKGRDKMKKIINTPVTNEQLKNLKIGDFVYITGKIYTARDAAHKRMIEQLDKG